MTVGSQLKQTLASLKGVQGTLKIYSVQSQDEESKAVYQEAQEAAGEIIDDLEKRVKEIELKEPQYKGY